MTRVRRLAMVLASKESVGDVGDVLEGMKADETSLNLTNKEVSQDADNHGAAFQGSCRTVTLQVVTTIHVDEMSGPAPTDQ
jgi:hypothetical protein